MIENCRYCHREMPIACRNTRCMEQGDRECFDALMRRGGGEYTVNQSEAQHRDTQFGLWLERRR